MNSLSAKRPETVKLGKEIYNVAEAWAIHDTMVISPLMYGTESQNKGWFTTFGGFAAQENHFFLNSRTESTASLAYCNKQTADSMDFAFRLNTIGCAFIAPTVRVLKDADGNGAAAITKINTQLAHWWETVLPRHCSFQFKVQQDYVVEAPAMMVSPGYGPTGGGASFEHERIGRLPANGVERNADYLPVMNMNVTQGVPTLKNRWSVGIKPLGIPRTGTIEAQITLSEIARYELGRIDFNPYYILAGDDTADAGHYKGFPARFMIQVSLLGNRLVQQRANYFA